MTRPARQLLAIMVVAALCADQAATAAPTLRPQAPARSAPARLPGARLAGARSAVAPVMELAGRLVSGLSWRFSRGVFPARAALLGRSRSVVSRPTLRAVDRSHFICPPPLSPFQFRLPPPLA